MSIRLKHDYDGEKRESLFVIDNINGTTSIESQIGGLKTKTHRMRIDWVETTESVIDVLCDDGIEEVIKNGE